MQDEGTCCETKEEELGPGFMCSISEMQRTAKIWKATMSSRFIILVMLSVASPTLGQLDFESAPINYNSVVPTNQVQSLAEQLAQGETKLTFDERHGYLRAILEHLDIPISSQMLVFSKTSFQLRQITSQRPRAIYFNDDVYVGWVQQGDVVEISSADPNQGAIFYTLSQKRSDRPHIVRDRGQCIVCHASSRTAGVPGHLVRSVYADVSGQPFYGSGTFTTDDRSPLEERWGGWYVTGTHGKQRHMGNCVVTNRDKPAELDVESGANVVDLADRLNTNPYLSRHSDIVALMVLGHQTRVHNLITRANFETRSAQYYDGVMNKAMNRPSGHRSDSAIRRIDSAAKKLVESMLFADEFPLTDTVVGTSDFTYEFTAKGPRDTKGRSLRDFDLATRLMKYPCSYLIYSDSFNALPDEVKARVWQRLFDALNDSDENSEFTHLSASDRRAILEILRETISDLPNYWNES